MRKTVFILVAAAAISFFLGTAAVKYTDNSEAVFKQIHFAKTQKPVVHLGNRFPAEAPQSQPEEQKPRNASQVTRQFVKLRRTENLALLHERFIREWERRRRRVFRQLGLSSKELNALRSAREQFYQTTDLAIVDLQGSNASNEIDKEMSYSDYANEAYDNYVKNLIGEERFTILEDALDKMNSEIQKKAPNKFVFVSAW